MKISELVVGDTYWAKNLRLIQQDEEFDWADYHHGTLSTTAPILQRALRIRRKKDQYKPYIYFSSEMRTIDFKKHEKCLLFVSNGKFVYARAQMISAFKNISVSPVRDRLQSHFVDAFLPHELAIIDSLVVEQPVFDLLVLMFKDGRRVLQCVRKSAYGRSNAINNILQHVGELDDYKYFTSEGRLTTFIFKNVQLKTINE